MRIKKALCAKPIDAHQCLGLMGTRCLNACCLAAMIGHCHGLLVEATIGVRMVLRNRDDGPAAAGMRIEPNDPAVRRQELFAFLVLAVVIWPIIAVGVVGAYGFIVWMSQLILGPPGPPPV